MTKQQAHAKLPADAKWSCSFGNPGEGGYAAYYRTKAGERWVISNGSWSDSGPYTWDCKLLAPETK